MKKMMKYILLLLIAAIGVNGNIKYRVFRH